MIAWGDLELREILWVLAALPGMWFWARNYLYARSTAKLTKDYPKVDGRRMWSQFSVELTRGFMGLEAVFLFIGIRAFFTPASSTQSTAAAWVTAILFILASAAISYLGVRWKMVDDALIRSARLRRDAARKQQQQHPDQ